MTNVPPLPHSRKDLVYYHYHFLDYYDAFVCYWSVLEYKPGVLSPSIIRDYYILQYCISGRGTCWIDGISYALAAGQCIAFPPQSCVTQLSDKQDPWHCIYIGITGLLLPSYFQQMGISKESPLFPWRNNSVVLDAMMQILHLEELPNTIEKISSLAANINLKNNLKRQNLLNTIFIECLNQVEAPPAPTMVQTLYIQKAQEYMNNNCHLCITVQDIAAHVGLTHNYFCTIFKKHIGKSPQEYLGQLRVKKACSFLQNFHISISDIAFSLGYKDATSFSRLFRRIMGITPSEYRRRLLEKKP